MEPCQRNTVISQSRGIQKYRGGGGLYETYLSQNIMFNFLHDYLLLNVIVEYISDTCIYVTAHRIPGGPKKDYRRTRDLSSYTLTHTFMCPPKDLDGTTLKGWFRLWKNRKTVLP